MDKTERTAEVSAMSTGALLISAERFRQVDDEGWTDEHDDHYTNDELTRAAGCYLGAELKETKPEIPRYKRTVTARGTWPWPKKWLKIDQTSDVRNLVKAGALIAAEIDRRLRAAERQQAKGQATP